MMLALLLPFLAAAAPPEPCVPTSYDDLLDLDGPGVLLLGEHRGHSEELRRVMRLIGTLRTRGPVTVALEAVPIARAPGLLAARSPAPDLDVLDANLNWSRTWGVPVDAYRGLLTLGLSDDIDAIHLVAAGPSTTLPPLDGGLPTGLEQDVAWFSGADLPTASRRPVAAHRAATDAALLDAALAGWDRKGTLVILADHTRVAGKAGLVWQLQHKAPDLAVRVAVLSSTDIDCLPDTPVWATPTLRASLPGMVGLGATLLETREP